MRIVLGPLLVLLAGGALAQSPPHSLPTDHWRQPLAAQGKAPAAWEPIEQSLKPEDCGQCHGEQYEAWRTSLHAQALSPGLVGQLLDLDAQETGECLRCHAPLAEQAQAFEAARRQKRAHDPKAQGLAASGVVCAACHVRGHRRFGPAERTSGQTGASANDRPHGGVFRSQDFSASEFCAVCHQFGQDQAINGKPLENTLAEWLASPFAKEGLTCQGCHMPDRRHLWRGIHDPEMTRSGLEVRAQALPDKARFALTSVRIGHAFPTYVTPKAMLRAQAEDGTGKPMAGAVAQHVIQRRVTEKDGVWTELSDTRLLPGQTATLEIAWGAARRVRFWLEIHPDDFYDHEVYDGLLAALPKGGPAARLIAKADAEARARRYRLFETVVERP
jgi:hypothetical protein